MYYTCGLFGKTELCSRGDIREILVYVHRRTILHSLIIIINDNTVEGLQIKIIFVPISSRSLRGNLCSESLYSHDHSVLF